MIQDDQGPENSEQRAAELESVASSYELAAGQAADAGQPRRAHQLLQSALASRELAAEIRRQTPALLATLKERTDATRRRLPSPAIRSPRKKHRQIA